MSLHCIFHVIYVLTCPRLIALANCIIDMSNLSSWTRSCLGFGGAKEVITSAHDFYTHFRFPQCHFGSGMVISMPRRPYDGYASTDLVGVYQYDWTLYEKREWGTGK